MIIKTSKKFKRHEIVHKKGMVNELLGSLRVCSSKIVSESFKIFDSQQYITTNNNRVIESTKANKGYSIYGNLAVSSDTVKICSWKWKILLLKIIKNVCIKQYSWSIISNIILKNSTKIYISKYH